VGIFCSNSGIALSDQTPLNECISRRHLRLNESSGSMTTNLNQIFRGNSVVYSELNTDNCMGGPILCAPGHLRRRRKIYWDKEGTKYEAGVQGEKFYFD
jgi:hypothetical protein